MTNLIYWAANLIGIAYMIVSMAVNKNSVLYEPCQTLTSSAYLVFAGIFAFMVLGFYMVRIEKANYCDEIFYSLPKGFSSKIISKILALITGVIVFTLLFTIEIYISYAIAKVEPIIYWKSFLYIILYLTIPFIICGFIGMLLALTIKSRASYSLMIILWILLTSSNELIFDVLGGITRGRGTKLLEKMAFFFNIGQTDISLSYQNTYGFPLEMQRWYIKFFMLSLLLFVILFLVVSKNYNKTKKPKILITIIFSFIIGFNVYGFMLPTQVLKTNDVSENPGWDERDYYIQNREANYANEHNFNIKAYDIKLSTIHQIKSETKIDYIITEETDNLVFTLFHGFRVKEIKNSRNEYLDFEQKGDQFKIKFNSKLSKDQEDYIIVKYEGNSSAYYFANEQSVFLPADFPWLPIEGSYNAFTFVDTFSTTILTTPLNRNKETKYKLQYKGPKTLCTNLNKVNKDTWEGTANNGVTLVGGMMKEKKIGEDTIYYPVSINNIDKALNEYIEEGQNIRKQIEKDLEYKVDNGNKHFFVDIPKDYFLSVNLLNFKDHIIIDESYLNNVHNKISKEYLPRQIINSDVINIENYSKDITYLLGYAYEYWYNLRFTNIEIYNILEDNIENLKQLMEWDKEDLNKCKQIEKEIRIRESVKDYIDKNKDDEKKVNNFLKKWFREMKDNSNFTSDNLEVLLNEEESR
jgi:hypothetical protein